MAAVGIIDEATAAQAISVVIIILMFI